MMPTAGRGAGSACQRDDEAVEPEAHDRAAVDERRRRRPTASMTRIARHRRWTPTPEPPFTTGSIEPGAEHRGEPDVDSSDRSILPARRTIVSASTSTASSDICCRTLTRFRSGQEDAVDDRPDDERERSPGPARGRACGAEPGRRRPAPAAAPGGCAGTGRRESRRSRAARPLPSRATSSSSSQPARARRTIRPWNITSTRSQIAQLVEFVGDDQHGQSARSRWTTLEQRLLGARRRRPRSG